MTKITAKSILSSRDSRGNRIDTILVTFPRFLLAELNTHRLFSRNSASSRAIPFEKMVKSVEDNPFIPIAWQKEHKGMQGSEYITNPKDYLDITNQELYELLLDTNDEIKTVGVDDNIQTSIENEWLVARELAIKSAKILNLLGITKQLANRILEPFMWHTVLITATEFENFFNLRMPVYEIDLDNLDLLKNV